jgi:hypothetical protein
MHATTYHDTIICYSYTYYSNMYYYTSMVLLSRSFVLDDCTTTRAWYYSHGALCSMIESKKSMIESIEIQFESIEACECI